MRGTGHHRSTIQRLVLRVSAACERATAKRRLAVSSDRFTTGCCTYLAYGPGERAVVVVEWTAAQLRSRTTPESVPHNPEAGFALAHHQTPVRGRLRGRVFEGLRPHTGDSGPQAPVRRIVMRMPRLQVYLSDELYRAVKERQLPASELLQGAVRAELRRRAILEETDRYLSELIDEVGEPSPAAVARAERLAQRVRGGKAGSSKAS